MIELKNLGGIIQIAYKQPKNIKKLVGGPLNGGRKDHQKDPGCSKCEKKWHACTISIEGGGTFKSSNTKKHTKSHYYIITFQI